MARIAAASAGDYEHFAANSDWLRRKRVEQRAPRVIADTLAYPRSADRSTAARF
jgi:hypothetical protein